MNARIGASVNLRGTDSAAKVTFSNLLQTVSRVQIDLAEARAGRHHTLIMCGPDTPHSLWLDFIVLSGTAVVDLLDAHGEPITGFAGPAAARVTDEDSVAALLQFGTASNKQRVALPFGAGRAPRALAFRVTMTTGSELFGLSLRCI